MMILLLPILSLSFDFDGSSLFKNLKEKAKDTMKQIGETAQELGSIIMQDPPEFTPPDESNATFIKIEISGDLSVTIDQGYEEKIQCDDSISQHVKTVVRNKVLYISMQQDIPGSVHVTVIALHNIKVSGSATVNCNSSIKTRDAEITVSGDSNVKLNIWSTEYVKIFASGSSNFEFKGYTSILSIKASGDGKLKFSGLSKKLNAMLSGSVEMRSFTFIAKVVNIDVTGTVIAEVFPTDLLVCQVTKSAQLSYKGTPQIDNGVPQFDL